MLAALTSFTLVGPLGLPWWLPLVCLAVAVGMSVGPAQPRRGETALARGGPRGDAHASAAQPPRRLRARGRLRADRAQLASAPRGRRGGFAVRRDCPAHRGGDSGPAFLRTERGRRRQRADPRSARRGRGGGRRGAPQRDRDPRRALLRGVGCARQRPVLPPPEAAPARPALQAAAARRTRARPVDGPRRSPAQRRGIIERAYFGGLSHLQITRVLGVGAAS
jgi:hypothetical protein